MGQHVAAMGGRRLRGEDLVRVKYDGHDEIAAELAGIACAIVAHRHPPAALRSRRDALTYALTTQKEDIPVSVLLSEYRPVEPELRPGR